MFSWTPQTQKQKVILIIEQEIFHEAYQVLATVYALGMRSLHSVRQFTLWAKRSEDTLFTSFTKLLKYISMTSQFSEQDKRLRAKT